MIGSLCETCAWMREVVTPKGSRFLLCQLSQPDPAYPKYPPQPVVRCDGYRKKEQTETMLEAHEACIAANPANAAKFKDVLDYLKQDLHLAH